MKIHSLEIPEERNERLSWLENQLVGVNLSDLVAEMRVVHSAIDSVGLKQILADQLPLVLESGLGQLDDRRVQQLLRNPDCLFELQEKILLEGSDYWQQLAQRPAVGFDTSLNVSSLSKESSSVSSTVSPINVDRTQPKPQPLTAPQRGTIVSQTWHQNPFLISLATAAAVLIATNMYGRFRASDSDKPTQVVSADNAKSWGWDHLVASDANLRPGDYLNDLADAAEEWFNQRPSNARQLATRIAELRQGCSMVILAEHSALAEADRKWLIEKCQAWAEKLDAHLAAVEAGQPVNAVRLAADKTLKQLIIALRKQASKRTA